MTITIKTGNAAFELRKAAEIARILHELADKLDNAELTPHPGAPWLLFDSNGNKVGIVRGS